MLQLNIRIGLRVIVLGLDLLGKVEKIWNDDNGQMLIKLRLDDGGTHICRSFEIADIDTLRAAILKM